MTGGPERKYTDRDVRENPTFVDLVEAYLHRYEGDFEFLIDNKMRLAQNITLTTGQVRGVLNCMRHDPRVRNLPEPLPYEDNVIDLQPRKRQRQKYGMEDCDKLEPHYPHNWGNDEGIYKCSGIEWAINRNSFTKPAIVRRPFAVARTGAYIHKVDLHGSHHFRWYPEPHDWGWVMEPVLHVKLACKYPHWIEKPLLFSVEKDVPEPIRTDRSNCPHCGGLAP